MNVRRLGRLAMMAVFALLISMLVGCGSADNTGPSLQNIPRYPNASAGESMQQSSLGGIVGGKLEQFTTTDSFDEVMDFYSQALDQHKPEFLSHKSPLGRQTAISIPQDHGMITVAVQEFTAEGVVNITLMAVGS